MKTFHPTQGEIEVPDSIVEINQHIKATRAMIENNYNPVVMAYLDSCESALDMYRRESDEL